MTATCVMVLGTTSGAGKSWLATALCRWYARQGLRVAPYKAQNMSNNARVVAGGEIGSAQWFQARAARVEPDVRMNPLLLKPERDTHSQVVLLGQVDEALPLLQDARQGFVALKLNHWVEHVDELLARAESRALTLDDLIAMVRAARRGDHRAGEEAWEICQKLARADDAGLSALGRGLQRVVAGESAEIALAAVPDDLRTSVLEGLRG